ncbi:MAG: TRAP transporter large permease subunit [Clostridiales bacterium]|nr:TRAP transporter large permease subunit [Clostridiales bacterium]
MLIVIIPILFLMLVSAVKRIPVIGGNLVAAFVGSGILAMLLGGVYQPAVWGSAWLKGLDQVAYIIFIVIFGSVFSALQVKSGAMDTVLNTLRAIFGHTPQGLVLAILIAMYLGGSLVGTVAAVGAVIGLLVVPALDDMGLDPDLICAIIVTGGSLGAIMPLISNAVNVACSIMDIPTDQVLQISYVTVAIAIVLVSTFVCKVYIGKKYQMPQHLIPKESPFTILKREWSRLIPLLILILLVALNSIPAIKFDVTGSLLKAIPAGDTNLYAMINTVPVFGKITNNIVLSLIVAIIAAFLCSKELRTDSGTLIKNSLYNIRASVIIQIFAGFFLGAFRAGGQMEAIAAWASGLSALALKFGGSISLLLGGMLMGAQSTTQTTLLPILGSAWTAIGVSDIHAAVASAHLAAAGQGLPPADLNTFVIAGLVSSLLHKKVNPMRSMLLTVPYCMVLAGLGLIFLFI